MILKARKRSKLAINQNYLSLQSSPGWLPELALHEDARGVNLLLRIDHPPVNVTVNDHFESGVPQQIPDFILGTSGAVFSHVEILRNFMAQFEP